MIRLKKSANSAGVSKPVLCPDITCSARPVKWADPGPVVDAGSVVDPGPAGS